MLNRCGFVVVITVAAFLTGCGGKEEVKKNEGTIVNTPPTAVSGSAGTTSGAPATNKANPPPPIPKIVE